MALESEIPARSRLVGHLGYPQRGEIGEAWIAGRTFLEDERRNRDEKQM